MRQRIIQRCRARQQFRRLGRFSGIALQFATLLIVFAPPLHAAGEHWVGTWATVPVAKENNPQPGELMIGGDDVTLRQIVHTSIGGDGLRIVLSNAFGITPLKIGAVEVGVSTGSDMGSMVAGTAHPVTFAGKANVMIPAGAEAVSDAVAFAIRPETDLAISVFVPMQPAKQLSFHSAACTTNFIVKGDQTASVTLRNAKEMKSWYLLKSIDVETNVKDAAAVVAFGDSITDGSATVDTNRRWPDDLARRLLANRKTEHLSVLNAGYAGNRLLHDAGGPDALARFDRDVLDLDGVKYMIVMEGINDIGHSEELVGASDKVTADQLVWALTQLVVRAHMHGIKVIGATLTPYAGSKYASPSGEKMREQVNAWIRSGGVLDGFVDFDKATRDPSNPMQYFPAYDSGDHLHPSDAGHQAMADSIDLSQFN